MKLMRFGPVGGEKPAMALADGRKVDVSGFGQDYNEAFFGGDGLARLADWVGAQGDRLPEVPEGARLGPAIARPSKIVCIGLNYVAHVRESGMAVPEVPVVFFKATSALCGPNDPLVMPIGGTKTDWEVELGVVIGAKARYVDPAEAMGHVAGYVLHNDYSERAFQLEMGGQWVKGKSHDTFAPVGPFVATKDEIKDPHNLGLWLKVNGEMLQNGNTSDFIFDIPYVVSYLSQFMTLLPGDLVSTGTPPGVGLGFDPPRYLKPGDVVELGIDGLGSATQKAVAYGQSQ